MKLAAHETATPLWGKLSEHFETSLAKLRARLENPSITDAETAMLRWQIKGFKELIAMAEPERQEGDRR